MMEQHKTEPWKARGDEIGYVSNDDDQTYGMVLPIGNLFGDNYEANARRIVACVNACAGIPTDVLEDKSILKADADFRIKHKELEKQRDELLSELMAKASAAITAMEQQTAATAADEDRWIEWKGGSICPVKRGTMVKVKYRDGQELGPFPALQNLDHFARDAGPAFWINERQANDIVAYRVVHGGAK